MWRAFYWDERAEAPEKGKKNSITGPSSTTDPLFSVPLPFDSAGIQFGDERGPQGVNGAKSAMHTANW